MAGRQVRCPTCEAEFIAPGSPQPVAAAVNGGSRPVREERIRATRPPQHEDVPEVEAVEAVEPVHESPPARD